MSLSLRTRLALSTALTLAAAPAAFADVTAADVWQNMNAPTTAMGFTVNATTAQDGATTTYSNLSYDFTLPMGIGGGSITMPDIVMTENGDGTVVVDYSDQMEMGISGFATGEGSFSATILISGEGNEYLASGTPGDVTYVANANGVKIELLNIMVDNAVMPGFEMSMDVQGSGTVTQRIIEGDLVRMSLLTQTGAGSSQLRLVDPTGNTTLIDGTNETGSFGMELALPADGSDLLNLAPALEQGLGFLLTFENQGSRNTQTVTNASGGQVSSQSTIVGPGSGELRLDADGLVAAGATAGLDMILQDQFLPFPVTLSATAMEAAYDVPISASEDPQDMQFLLRLDDLAVGDDLWNMIDPGQGLDRSPADAVIDLTGTAVLSRDVMNFMEFGMALEMGDSIGELRSLDINAIELGALGAVLQASGAFTFDNSDMFTYPGFPKPVGSFSMTLDGLNSAMDQLVSAGLLSSDDIFGARMMIGMVATASGEDSLSSTIELGEDGSLSANGQRLR